MPDRCYCHLGEINDDMQLASDLVAMADYFIHVRAASDWLGQRIGSFTPYTAIKRYDGSGTIHLMLDPREPLISVTTLVDDATTLSSTDYLLYPRNKHWENGPYSRITIDPDASGISAWTRERDIVVITGSWGKYSKTVSLGVNATLADGTATTLTASAGGYIYPGMVLLVESEQMLVTKQLTGTTYTVVRGANGTTGAAHATKAASYYAPPWDINYLCRQIAALMKKKADSKFAGKTGNVDIGEVYYHQEFPKEVLKEVERNYRIVQL